MKKVLYQEAKGTVESSSRLFEQFALAVKQALAQADWKKKRSITRSIVNRVEVGKEPINMVFRIDPVDKTTDSDPLPLL